MAGRTDLGSYYTSSKKILLVSKIQFWPGSDPPRPPATSWDGARQPVARPSHKTRAWRSPDDQWSQGGRAGRRPKECQGRILSSGQESPRAPARLAHQVDLQAFGGPPGSSFVTWVGNRLSSTIPRGRWGPWCVGTRPELNFTAQNYFFLMTCIMADIRAQIRTAGHLASRRN